MGDTSLGQLAFVKETVAGVPPATPAFKVLDFVDEDLSMTLNKVRSAAVTNAGVVKSSRTAGKEVTGGVRFELYKATEVDALLAGLLGNAFAGSPLVAKAGGTVTDLFTFERKLDTGDYRRFSGFRPGSAEFTLAPEANIMVRLTGSGFTSTTDSAIIAGATYTAAASTGKLNALDVTGITLSNGLTASLDYESLSFTVNAQVSASKRLGPATIRRIKKGQTLVTGTLRAYVDRTMADAFNADTHFNMDVQTALAGAGYGFLFKNVSVTEYSDPNTGNNDEFMSNVSFEATLDDTFASSFGISKTS